MTKPTRSRIVEKLATFPKDSIAHNLFHCELVLQGESYPSVFRGATITKEGAKYLEENETIKSGFEGWNYFSVSLDGDLKQRLSKLIAQIENWYLQNELEWGTPPDFLTRWR